MCKANVRISCKYWKHGSCRSKEAFMFNGRRQPLCLLQDESLRMYTNNVSDLSNECSFFKETPIKHDIVEFRVLNQKSCIWEKRNINNIKPEDVFKIHTDININIDTNLVFVCLGNYIKPDTNILELSYNSISDIVSKVSTKEMYIEFDTAKGVFI